MAGCIFQKWSYQCSQPDILPVSCFSPPISRVCIPSSWTQGWLGPVSTNLMNRTLNGSGARSNKAIRPLFFLSLVIITCESSHHAVTKSKLVSFEGPHGSPMCKGTGASNLQPVSATRGELSEPSVECSFRASHLPTKIPDITEQWQAITVAPYSNS